VIRASHCLDRTFCTRNTALVTAGNAYFRHAKLWPRKPLRLSSNRALAAKLSAVRRRNGLHPREGRPPHEARWICMAHIAHNPVILDLQVKASRGYLKFIFWIRRWISCSAATREAWASESRFWIYPTEMASFDPLRIQKRNVTAYPLTLGTQRVTEIPSKRI
jgi:hypothetical protein